MSCNALKVSAKVSTSRASRAQQPRRMVACAAASAEVTDKVRNIIAEQLGSDLDTVVADSKFVDLGADSLDTVEIMMALEEEFSITLDEDGAEKITTVQEAADLIADQAA
jgi:acyl carrier protein